MDATKFLGITIAVDHIAREVRLSAPDVIPKAHKQFAPNSTSIARSPAVYQLPASDLQPKCPTLPTLLPLSLLMSIIAFNNSVEYSYTIALWST